MCVAAYRFVRGTLELKNEFSFTFKTKFFGLSHFWCDMQHSTQVKTVDVYNDLYQGFKCKETKNCYWAVRDDGFYFTDDLQKEWYKFDG